MTVCPTELPCLKSAKFQSLEPDSEVEVHYKSGASFKGHIEDYKKSGCGLFTWPNGASYEGEYDENARIGKGKYYPSYICNWWLQMEYILKDLKTS